MVGSGDWSPLSTLPVEFQRFGKRRTEMGHGRRAERASPHSGQWSRLQPLAPHHLPQLRSCLGKRDRPTQTNCSDLWPSTVDRPTAMAADSTWLQSRWTMSGWLKVLKVQGTWGWEGTSFRRPRPLSPVASSGSSQFTVHGAPASC